LALVYGALFAARAAASTNIVSVVETGGDNEPTDTIVAQWTGQTFPVSIAGEPVLGTTVGQNYTVGTFGAGAPAFVDRNHIYAADVANSLGIPSYLDGQEYIMSGNDNRDNASYRLDVTVAKPSIVYMLIDNRLQDGDAANPPTFGPANMQWMLDGGWAATANGLNRAGDPSVPDEVGFDEGSDTTINQYYSVYYKAFASGTLTLLQADNAGRNMYGVVVAAVPEPGTLLIGLAASCGLAAARRRHR
jgi:hypothetical protein